VICVTVGLTMTRREHDGCWKQSQGDFSVSIHSAGMQQQHYIRSQVRYHVPKISLTFTNMHGLRHDSAGLENREAERAIQARCRNLSVSSE